MNPIIRMGIWNSPVLGFVESEILNQQCLSRGNCDFQDNVSRRTSWIRVLKFARISGVRNIYSILCSVVYVDSTMRTSWQAKQLLDVSPDSTQRHNALPDIGSGGRGLTSNNLLTVFRGR